MASASPRRSLCHGVAAVPYTSNSVRSVNEQPAKPPPGQPLAKSGVWLPNTVNLAQRAGVSAGLGLTGVRRPRSAPGRRGTHGVDPAAVVPGDRPGGRDGPVGAVVGARDPVVIRGRAGPVPASC